MSLKIISASAGSGKTYRLGLEYLKFCFQHPQDDYFKHILAITFTNKATEEMKNRILEALKKLALGDEKADYLDELMSSCGMDAPSIAVKARSILNAILKQYHFYQIQTIDSFLYGLYQSFVTELNVPAGVELNLAQEKILQKTIRNYIDGIDEKKEDWSVIRKLMLRDESRGKRFQLHHLLEQISQLLSDEAFDGHTIFDDPGKIEALEAKFKSLIHEKDERFDIVRKKMGKLLVESGLSTNQFNGGSRSWVNTLLNDAFELKDILKKKTVFAVAEGQKEAMAKSAPEEYKSKYSAYQNSYQVLYDELLELRKSEREYNNALAILENWDSFYLINTLERELTDYLRQHSLISLTQVNQMLNRQMKSGDAALIYEKIGVRIKHVMVDEFQDTSVMQWNNLEPLIQECLANGHECLLVGDVKQSIYRFRNGNWRLLQEIVPREYGNFIQHESLDTNWRSVPEIVNFNNDFFNYLIPELQNEIGNISTEEYESINFSYEGWLPQIYADVEQKVSPSNRTKNGMVRIECLTYANQSEEEEELDRMLHHLKQALKDGYGLDDIAILVQKHKEASAISEYLLRREELHSENWPHVLEAAMELSKIPVIVLLMSLLKLKQDEMDRTALAEMDRMLDVLNIYKSEKSTKPEDLMDKLEMLGLREVFLFEFNTTIFFSKVFRVLGLNKKVEYFAAMDYLLSKSQEHGVRNGVDGKTFLKYWEEELYTSKIEVSELENQISVVTMHKSKGLEYPVVIIPFANNELYSRNTGRKQYLMADIEIIDQIDEHYEIPLSFGQSLETTDFAPYYFEEKAMQLIDMANVYYVAFTRARDRLVILSAEKNKTNNKNNLSGYVGDYIKGRDFIEENGWHCYQLGLGRSARQEIPDTLVEKLPDLVEYPIRMNWPLVIAGKRVSKILPNGEKTDQSYAVEKGLLVHYILEHVTHLNTINSAIQQSILKGLLPQDKSKEWEEELTNLLGRPELSQFYQDYEKVINERSIYMPGLGLKVPDRVVLKRDETLVLDYKTGEKLKKHEEQVRVYAKALREMDYPSPKAFLYYLSSGELISVSA